MNRLAKDKLDYPGPQPAPRASTARGRLRPFVASELGSKEEAFDARVRNAKDPRFRDIQTVSLYSSMRHAVGVGEGKNPIVSLPDAALERGKEFAGFWILPLPNPYRGTVTIKLDLCLPHHRVADKTRFRKVFLAEQSPR